MRSWTAPTELAVLLVLGAYAGLAAAADEGEPSAASSGPRLSAMHDASDHGSGGTGSDDSQMGPGGDGDHQPGNGGGPDGEGHHHGEDDDHCDEADFPIGDHPCDPWGSDDDDTTGWFRFEHAGEMASEGRRVVLEVERRGLLDGAASVEYRTLDGTADSSDYVPLSGELSWGDGDGSSRSLVVEIREDDRREGYEYFEVELVAPIGGEIDWHHGVAHVTILDADQGPYFGDGGSIGFLRREYRGREADGLVPIGVVRRHGSKGDASVDYRTYAVSATAGFDYDDVAGTLYWGDGEGGPQYFEVPLFGDDSAEGNETIGLVLENVAGADLDPELADSLLQLLDENGDTSLCQTDDETHCLLGGRFRVQVSWADFEGHLGRGHVRHLGDQAGLFWFFREDNVEMLVKMVDGCGLTTSPSYRLFVAATTSVDYTLTVTDTVTGLTNQYSNPLGSAAEPVQDTFSFSTCDASP